MDLVVPNSITSATLANSNSLSQSNSLANTDYATHSQDEVCTDGSTSSEVIAIGSFDKTIYRKLSSQEEMKVVELPERIKNEWDLFLINATEYANGSTVEGFTAINDYLGSLGLDKTVCPTPTQSSSYTPIWHKDDYVPQLSYNL